MLRPARKAREVMLGPQSPRAVIKSRPAGLTAGLRAGPARVQLWYGYEGGFMGLDFEVTGKGTVVRCCLGTGLDIQGGRCKLGQILE